MNALMNFKHALGAMAAALLWLMPFAAEAQTATTSRPVVVSGSSTIFPLMTDMARRFESANPGTAIEVRSGTSGKGIAELRSEASDFAMVSRPLAIHERDLFAFPLCRDGAAILVHASNSLNGVNVRQLRELLTGEVRDWKQLGARPGAVRVAWRVEGQAIPELLLQHLKLKPEQIRSHATFFENIDAVKFVAGNRNAITVAALAVAERAAKSGVPIKLLAFEGVAASTRAVRDRTYQLSRPLLLVTRSVPTGLQKRFVDYAVSSAVIDLHEKHGFVPYQE
jgi:phosphate transport system substrate-binding protein